MYTIATQGGVDAPYFWIELRKECFFATPEEAQKECDRRNALDKEGADYGEYFVEEIDVDEDGVDY